MKPFDRILIHRHTDNNWYVWGAYTDVDYYEPPVDATILDNHHDAKLLALSLGEQFKFISRISYLTDAEIIRGLRFTLDTIQFPTHCVGCGDIEGCSPDRKCKKNQCIYRKEYVIDKYNTDLLKILIDDLYTTDKIKLNNIITNVWEKRYGNLKEKYPYQ